MNRDGLSAPVPHPARPNRRDERDGSVLYSSKEDTRFYLFDI